MWTLLAILIACALDWFFGDPPRIPHLVVWIGKLISFLEKELRAVFPSTPRGEFCAGVVLVVLTCALPTLLCLLICLLLGLVHPALRMAFEALVCWQCLAMRSLEQAGRNVKAALRQSLEAGRKAVGMIVGRDTTQLTEEEVIKATVETVAENTADGVVAPLFYMMIGGAPMAVLYKAINTMDSMVGYVVEPYTHFGTAAAKTDDVANWIPARLTGLAMVAATVPSQLSTWGAWHVWLRDRRNHRSPNSAQTESACAGALGIQLGGDHVYFGTLVSKPTIGDPLRQPTADDIDRTNTLMIWTSIIAVLVFSFIRLLVIGALVCL